LKLGSIKAFVVAVIFLAVSIALGVASIYPAATGTNQSVIIIDDTFHLSPNEVRRQGIGLFHGDENLTLKVIGNDVFVKNFSVVAYDGYRFNISTTQNVTYAFNAGADYYEAVFTTDAANSGSIRFQVAVFQPQVTHPLAWLSTPAKIMFLASLGAVMVVLLKMGILNRIAMGHSRNRLETINQTNRRRLIALLALSLVLWFLVLALNPNPLGTFENWYTDHARHPYVASLFLKDGLAIFSQPLDTLASQDNSRFMFVTWPEMPHLYPIGSVALFLPFGVLLQAGVDAVLVYKLEIAVFLVFAHICLYLFLGVFFKKDMHLFWKLVGFYIAYVSLVVYAANGMFDSVAFVFGLGAVFMFMTGRYDRFVLLTAVSVLFKYQTGIFLLPFIAVGVLELLKTNRLLNIIRNKSVVLGVILVAASGFTAYLSAPYLLATRPELVLNGINAFMPHAQISWSMQLTAVLLTLGVTIAYSAYMLNKNRFLSLSALFLLLPSFTLPYFQNWYLPFMFVYVIVPQRREEVEATMVWLVFMVFVLSFGGVAFNPLQIWAHFQKMLGL
jgi:hypothetical protein